MIWENSQKKKICTFRGAVWYGFCISKSAFLYKFCTLWSAKLPSAPHFIHPPPTNEYPPFPPTARSLCGLSVLVSSAQTPPARRWFACWRPWFRRHRLGWASFASNSVISDEYNLSFLHNSNDLRRKDITSFYILKNKMDLFLNL